jgi:biopolymer transport protein ExbD
MAEINMIPLIDVMLVLLVIFIVTAPLLTHAVKDRPAPCQQPGKHRPSGKTCRFPSMPAGSIYWNGELIQADALPARMGETARLDTQTELHIRADGDTAYKQVVKVMSDASRAGLTRIGFVTDPRQP